MRFRYLCPLCTLFWLCSHKEKRQKFHVSCGHWRIKSSHRITSEGGQHVISVDEKKQLRGYSELSDLKPGCWVCSIKHQGGEASRTSEHAWAKISEASRNNWLCNFGGIPDSRVMSAPGTGISYQIYNRETSKSGQGKDTFPKGGFYFPKKKVST